MDNSPLARLPRELRDTIYAYALYFEDAIILNIAGQKISLQSPNPSEHPLALTKVCKQTRDECHSIFYSSNIFRIRPYPGDARNSETIETWLKQIGATNRSSIHQVDIELGLWTPGYTPPSSATRFATPLTAQAAAYTTCFQDMNVPCTFSIDIRYSDVPVLGTIRLAEVDLVNEEKLFGTKDSKFEQACLRQAQIIKEANAENDIESYAVIRLIMGVDLCRNRFAEFLHAVKVQHRRGW